MAAKQLVIRGIRDAKIAAWNSTGSYGTAVDIRGIREASLELELDTDQQEGDDIVVDRYSSIIAANVGLQNAFVDFEAAAIMTGATFTSGAAYDDFMLDGENNPPFVGLAFKAVASDGQETHYFLPKAKLSGNVSLTMAYGSYLVPQAEFQAIKDGASGMVRGRNFASATGLVIPLATAVD